MPVHKSKLGKFATATAKSLGSKVRKDLKGVRKRFGKAIAIKVACDILELKLNIPAKDCKDVAIGVIDVIGKLK